jgi:sporulation protein YlmC with PRC-barrel domain
MSLARFPLALVVFMLVLAMALSACDVAEPGPVVTEPGAEVVQPGADTTQPEAAAAVRGVGNAADMMIPATTLMGFEIDGPSDEELGTIEDLLIDLNTGNVLFATVEHGGFLDIGESDLPVPLNALQFSDDSDEFRIPIPEETFENFPDIPSDWPGDFAAGWEQEMGTFWSNAGFDTSLLQEASSGRMAWASDLINYGVDTFDAPGFGDVQDLIVDLPNSSIRYLALSFSDVGAYGADWRLVPYSAFHVAGEGDIAALSLNDDFDMNLIFDAPAIPAAGFGDIDTWTATWDDEIENFWTNAGIVVAGATAAGAEAVQEGAEAVQEGAAAVQEEAEQAVQEGTEAEAIAAGTTDMMLLASTLLDKEVDNLNDEELGQIEDLLIDVNSGKVLFATIEHGGFLDIGDSDFPVPLSAMQWGAESDEMIVSITPDMLESFPDIEDNWPGDFAEGWHDALDEFWSAAGFDVSTTQNIEPGRVVWASELIGYGIGATDASGLGNVQDMVIDLPTSQVKYMILSLADTATYGSEWIAVPYTAFDAAAFGDEFIFAGDFDRAVLVDAPRIDEVGLYDTGEFNTEWDEQFEAFWREHGFNFGGT